MTSTTSPATDELTLNVVQEIEIDAAPEATFSALIHQLGEGFTPSEGPSLNMKLEPWPGGRWFRDLGGENGHLWGHVQVIKRPTLLEITGPLFMSYPAISHVQFRLTRAGEGTLLAFCHQALGLIHDDHREGVVKGWAHVLEGVRTHAIRR